ncbi:MAG TPA: hypothetical protein QF478_04020 [Verrucomicrobiota bacterium]|nr:hypothetical protein [Verrucomicrobiota bacterium]
MDFLALLIPLTLGLPIVVLVITVPVITVPVITVPVITVPVITVPVITVPVITVPVITVPVLVVAVLVVAVTIVIMVIVATVTVMIVVMTKQCVRGRRHRFFGNVYRGVKCLAGGFERVKRGSNSVTSHPEGILDYFTCKALVIPVMTVMSAADSDQRGHHSE